MEGIREVTVLSVVLRIAAAVLLGGFMGMERGIKRRAAGLRTYMLVCVGSCMIMLTNQYIFQNYQSGDPVRMGAQVVSGIGFLGAGTIIVTRHNQIKGLTTAAGLWTAAIVGLALGGGFYEGGIAATGLILLAELLFSKLEYRMLDNAPEVNLFMEYSGKPCLEKVLKLYRERELKVINMEITRSTESETHNACAIFTLRLNRRCGVERLLTEMNAVPGVVSVEEL